MLINHFLVQHRMRQEVTGLDIPRVVDLAKTIPVARDIGRGGRHERGCERQSSRRCGSAKIVPHRDIVSQ